MGCSVQKPLPKKDLKQFDPKLNQMVTVPVLYDAKNNPIVRRRQGDNTDISPIKKG